MTQRNLTDSLVAALGSIPGHEHKVDPTRPAPAPFTIAISREPGAFGTVVARELGQRLGWAVYDEELLTLVAKEMGTHVNFLQLLDEKPMSWLEQCVVNMVSQYNLNHDSYMVHLIATIRSLGARGHCVLVGRGANFILPPAETLHIRLVADLRDRIAHIRQLKGLSEKDAARWVEKAAHERRDFIRKHFSKDVTDPLLYDLVLNLSRLRVPDCVGVIIDTLQRFETRQLAEKQDRATFATT